MARLIGVFGGTFDPPHIGHIILAEEGRIFLDLEKVLWVPTGVPPHKEGREISPIAHRLDMVRTAIRGYAGFELSLADVQRPGPHYSVGTLRWLQERHPQERYVFMMGSDSLADLPSWRSPRELVAGCEMLGIWHRPDVQLDMPSLEEKIPGIREKVRFIETAFIRISAREIRRRVRAGIPYQHLIQPAVRELIIRKGLYA
jgi:nicotinate-nucleotide adenylyltransferase